MDQLGILYQEHIARLQHGYEAVMVKHQLDAIVLGSGHATTRNRFDDQFWPLSVTPAFAHWLPLQEPDCFVIVRPGRKPTLVRTVTDDYWHTATVPEAAHFWASFDLVEVNPGGAKAHFPVLRCDYITRDPLGMSGGGVNPPDLVAALDALRTVKTEYEVHCMLEASRRAARGHRAAERAFLESDRSELALHLTYLGASEQDDANTPYKGIVALGPHAAVLHHAVYATKPVGKTDTSLLIDAGARYLGYGSDITRTYARGGGAAARQFASLITAVDGVQRTLCEIIGTGVEYEALHDHSHRLLAVALEEIGLLHGTPDECVAKGVTRAFFPHGLGHSLGLVTHDVGCKPRPPRPENKYLRTTCTIAKDQVFTIEPGVYFIESLLAPLRADVRKWLVNWPLVEVLKPFGGVRIEDNVQILEDGVRNFTREAFSPAGVKYLTARTATALNADSGGAAPRKRSGAPTMGPDDFDKPQVTVAAAPSVATADSDLDDFI
ncbi:MAG: Xaa-Pro dipeptidase [Kofleriaceae bacterium]|nr:Xaa-Pro dipeptidase [Kofleriaceae bacterium]